MLIYYCLDYRFRELFEIEYCFSEIGWVQLVFCILFIILVVRDEDVDCFCVNWVVFFQCSELFIYRVGICVLFRFILCDNYYM